MLHNFFIQNDNINLTERMTSWIVEKCQYISEYVSMRFFNFIYSMHSSAWTPHVDSRHPGMMWRCFPQSLLWSHRTAGFLSLQGLQVGASELWGVWILLLQDQTRGWSMVESVMCRWLKSSQHSVSLWVWTLRYHSVSCSSPYIAYNLFLTAMNI